MTDTIFALATAPGKAALAIVRVSGPAAAAVLAAIADGPAVPRRATLRTLRAPDGSVLDRGLALLFPGPGSFTGEDCVELHLHGGPAVVDAVGEALVGAGVRPAEPGEFTRRAFENGKLDLDQAEAVADLIDAESAAQARQALGQLEGSLGRRYGQWRNALLTILGSLEAAVDFPDEEVPTDVADRARAPLERLLGDLAQALDDRTRGQRIREGYRVAIIGAPNAGKSTLLNLLAGRDAAIVTDTPGATRDVIEIPFDMSGYRVILADTAGVREASDPVEVEGVRRAKAWATGADLRIWVVDRASSDGAWRQPGALVAAGDIALFSKADLTAGKDYRPALGAAGSIGADVFELSLIGGDPSELRTALSARVVRDLSGAEFPAVTRRRHQQLLAQAHDHLARAVTAFGRPELVAEDVRLAARTLAAVTGRVGAEDILGEIFATFCIGK
ncbi:MAG TPA: tRNA uridine-5-carboxymethylaminomethyl(34) synthesis GTPase MnmE [Caulobacteraceae bacterium]|nr:tRNA uridine-5-carboxymethylaminomethyl(34) synthesis GTPase MnmE [Caulobacteraceae bacterium]